MKIETDWLRRGPKARTTKSKARIDSANDLIGQLKEVNLRTQTSSAGIDFSATERQTKRLVEFDHVRCVLGEGDSAKTIVEDLNFSDYERGAGGLSRAEWEWEDDAVAAVAGGDSADEWGDQAGGVSEGRLLFADSRTG